MNEIINILVGIITTLVSSLIGWWIYKTWQSRRPRRPIEFSIEQFTDESWLVAFPEKSPDLAAIDGVRMGDKQAYAAALKNGAVDINQTKLRIRLRSLLDTPILIKGLLIKTEKREPLSGARVCCPSAGSKSDIILMVNLDENNPSTWEARDEDFEITPIGIHPYFSRKSITLAKDEYETLILVGKASKFCVSWKIQLEFETAGHSGFITLDSNGMPFRTTGEAVNGYATDLVWAWYDGHRILPATTFDE